MTAARPFVAGLGESEAQSLWLMVVKNMFRAADGESTESVTRKEELAAEQR
ncbi:hypothetical protein OG205_01455 [Lentzea sp. NBC_00516]|uniref:hypothetical protein n=1 Tax=Lentzea sp. NBC_00516 TaxID=2903582 RepID=UPI002E81E60C|nr:hypothetical protein [Lentzea sp. NBC_00516]WUD25692.1 hypothetical protein OG205_01455 [Lentzea sp. NBC_00516]